MIYKPTIEVVPLAAGVRWRGGGDYHYAEKMDGKFSLEESAGCIVAGEKMPDGRFFAFNVARAFGEDVTRRPFRERQALLDAWTAIGLQAGDRQRRGIPGSRTRSRGGGGSCESLGRAVGRNAVQVQARIRLTPLL